MNLFFQYSIVSLIIGQNIMKPTWSTLTYWVFSNITKSTTRVVMVWEISTWQTTKQTKIIKDCELELMPNSMLVWGVVQFLILKGIEPSVLVPTFVFGCLNMHCDIKKAYGYLVTKRLYN